jgi:hypothetical protein
MLTFPVAWELLTVASGVPPFRPTNPPTSEFPLTLLVA